MSKKPLKTKEDADSQQNIRDLRRRAEEFVGGELSFFESKDIPYALQEQFLQHVVDFEESNEWITSFDLLVQGGMELPTPDELDGSQLTAKLWEVIRGLAMLRMFLYNTDHLSDRELYEELWYEVLQEENPVMQLNNGSACHIDLVSSGSEEAIEFYLRYYADEEDRHAWAKDWPTFVIPDHQTLPYDRDRHLPSRFQSEWRQCYQPS
jgi:hypothetical protein